jgi:hypothetical protein
MASIERVKSCRKSPGKCNKCDREIKQGEPYKFWKITRFSSKSVRCVDCPDPRPSQLTNSEFYGQLYGQQESIEDALKSGEMDEIIGAVDCAIDDFDGMMSDLDDKISNLESSFPNGCPSLDTLQERRDALEPYKEELESWKSDAESRWDSDKKEEDDENDDFKPDPAKTKEENDEALAALNEEHNQNLRDELVGDLEGISCGV